MKKLLFLIMLTISLALHAAGNKGASIDFPVTQYDFGVAKESGDRITIEYEFTNTGDAPLVIISAKSSCGCTKPTYPKEPVAPGAKSKISVTFNPHNQIGEVHKTVTVLTNDKKHKKVVLRITGIVKE